MSVRVHDSALKTVRFAFSFDTPHLYEGIPLYRPTSGDVLFAWWLSKSEDFDGGSEELPPFLNLAQEGSDIYGTIVGTGLKSSNPVDAVDTFRQDEDATYAELRRGELLFAMALNDSVLMLSVVDETGQPPDPLPTQGRAEFGLAVLTTRP